MTYRERMERRAEKRAEWAEKREAKSASRFNGARQILEHIPPGQPILVGHHSEKRHRRDLEKVDNHMRAGIEHANMAGHHRAAASTILHNLDRAIYDDDPDAVEQLEARIEALEAKRERIKAYNKSARKGAPDLSLLDEGEREEVQVNIRIGYMTPRSNFPAYVLSNLGGNIKRNRDRLAAVKRRQELAAAAEESPEGFTIIGTGEYINVVFADVPPRETREALKAAGFWYSKGRWNGQAANLPAELRRD